MTRPKKKEQSVCVYEAGNVFMVAHGYYHHFSLAFHFSWQKRGKKEMLLKDKILFVLLKKNVFCWNSFLFCLINELPDGIR